MIKASNAMQVDNVLEHIMHQIELLLEKFLEEKPNQDHKDNIDSHASSSETRIKAKPDKQNEVELSRKDEIDVELELNTLSIEEIQSEALWFICPKRPLSPNVTLSKNLKFNEDGSVYVDYSSQFIPNIRIAQINKVGDVQISIECPLCQKSSMKVTLRGTTLLIHGEKHMNRMTKEYLNTVRVGKFDLEVPIGKLDDEKTFDYQKRSFDFQDGVITIIIPVVRGRTRYLLE